MKFGIVINEGPYQHQASDSAFLFTKAAIEEARTKKLERIENLDEWLEKL